MSGIDSRPQGLATGPARRERRCPRDVAALRRRRPRTRRVTRRPGQSLVQLGSVLYEQGRYQEAEQVLIEAIAVLERGFGRDHIEVSTALNNLAVCYKYLARFADASPLYQRALEIAQQALGPNHPE